MTRPSFCLSTAISVGLSLALLGACSPTINPRGNQPTVSQLAEIKPGTTDKATVTRILGSPSTVANFDTTTWYYISQKTEELAFFKPEVRDPEIIAVNFDKDGVVTDVQKLNKKVPRNIEPVARTTPAPGKELSFIEQLLGNFGRFNTQSASPSGQ